MEQSYFENNFKNIYDSVTKFSFYKSWSRDSILNFIAYFEKIVLTGRNKKLIVKVNLFIKYGIYKFKFVNENQTFIITSLKRDYYTKYILEISLQINSLEKDLENKGYTKLIEQYKELSQKLFNAALHKKYSKENRGNYTIV